MSRVRSKPRSFFSRLTAQASSSSQAPNVPAASRTSIPSRAAASSPKLSPGDWSVRNGPAGRLRRLGLGERPLAFGASFPKTRLLDVLGPTRVAPLQAVHVPSRVLWVNFELACALGFEVPEPPSLTPALEAQLLDALSWRALEEGEAAGERRTMTLFADKYSGTYQGRHQGAGRAAFLPFGNVNVKGVGSTPLKHRESSFDHAHGGASLKEGMLEAIWGEVNTQLFTKGGSRILAVLDTGEFTTWEDGSREKRALILRMGTQLRPAHLLAEGGVGAHEVFERATEETGDLVQKKTRQGWVPDYRATMLRLVDNHARTAAEQFRWRILHGGMSTSNIELDGAQLDAGTPTALPETAPVFVLPHMDRETATFGREHWARAAELELAYQEVLRSLVLARIVVPKGTRIDFAKEMGQAYSRHFAQQMLEATGLRPAVATVLREEEPALVEQYAGLLQTLAGLYHPDSDRNVDKRVLTQASTFDIFSVLRGLPRLRAAASPEASRVEETQALLRFQATPGEGAAQRALVERLLTQVGASSDSSLEDALPKIASSLERLHRDVLTHAERLACARGLAQTPAQFQASVRCRAEFENQPLEPLYRARLGEHLVETVDRYLELQDPKVVAGAIERVVAASARSVDALLRQGEAQRLSPDVLELGIRHVDGIRYSVVASNLGDRQLRVSLAVEGDLLQGYSLPSFGSTLRFTQEELAGLVYHFTTDGWGQGGGPAFLEKRADLIWDNGRLSGVRFDVPMLPHSQVGWLEGMFLLESRDRMEFKDGASNFVSYPFAIPDGDELRQLGEELETLGG